MGLTKSKAARLERRRRRRAAEAAARELMAELDAWQAQRHRERSAARYAHHQNEHVDAEYLNVWLFLWLLAAISGAYVALTWR